MTNKITMDGEPLEVGDEVYCLLNGKGKVESIDSKAKFPIEVAFSRGNSTYTNNFKPWSRHENRTLYWQKPEIISPPKPKKKPKKKVKKKVKVWDWFIEYKDGSICRMTGQLADFQNFFHINLAQKIDGTEREVER